MFSKYSVCCWSGTWRFWVDRMKTSRFSSRRTWFLDTVLSPSRLRLAGLIHPVTTSNSMKEGRNVSFGVFCCEYCFQSNFVKFYKQSHGKALHRPQRLLFARDHVGSVQKSIWAEINSCQIFPPVIGDVAVCSVATVLISSAFQ